MTLPVQWLLRTLLATLDFTARLHCSQQQSAIGLTSKRYEIGCPLLLITNRKSHTVFRLVPTSMTLNDLERRNSSYFALFHRIR